MALNITKPFVVIQFKKLPVPRAHSFQCIPRSWVKCVNDNRHMTVAYPEEEPTNKVDKMILKKKLPLNRWPLYPAVFIVELESLEQWQYVIQKYISANDSLEANKLASLIQGLFGADPSSAQTITPLASGDNISKQKKRSIASPKTSNKKAKLDVPELISLNSKVSDVQPTDTEQIAVDKEILVKIVQVLEGLKPMIDVIRGIIQEKPATRSNNGIMN